MPENSPISYTDTDDSPDTDASAAEDRLAIAGTHCSLAPPEGFTPATNFIGLERVDGLSMIFMDLDKGNFYTNAATFSAETFQQHGVTVFDYQETSIDGYPAKYAVIRYNDSLNAHTLVFGDSTFCVTVTGIIPANDTSIINQLNNSFYSITYDKNRVLNPLETANFIINDNESNFKFLFASGGIYTYGPDTTSTHKIESSKALKMVALVPLPVDNNEKDVSGFIMERLAKYGLTIREVKNESYEKINNYDTYKAEVYGTMKGADVLIYIMHISTGEKAVMMEGIANTDFVTSLSQFEKFSYAIRIKP